MNRVNKLLTVVGEERGPGDDLSGSCRDRLGTWLGTWAIKGRDYRLILISSSSISSVVLMILALAE